MVNSEDAGQRWRIIAAMVLVGEDPHALVDAISRSSTTEAAVAAIAETFDVDEPSARAVLFSPFALISQQRREQLEAELTEMGIDPTSSAE